MEEVFCIMRARKLQRGSRGKNSLGACLRHLDRHQEASDISNPDRSDENETISRADVKATIEEAIKQHNERSKRKLRKDASVCSEFIFTYSPAAEENIDDDEYEERIFQFIKKEFPTAKVLRMDYHADESTAHWHILIMPTTADGRLSAREVFGGPADFQRHQTAFAECVADLGLERGIPKLKRQQANDRGAYNEPLWRYKSKQVKQAKRELRNVRKKINEAREELSRIADDVLDDRPQKQHFER